VEVLAFDSARYVGARIGIHNPAGTKVGSVSHLRNTEYVLVAGDRARVRSMVGAVVGAGLGHAVDRPVPVETARADGVLPV
jgi:adenine-specific DNA-methyltransferase